MVKRCLIQTRYRKVKMLLERSVSRPAFFGCFWVPRCLASKVRTYQGGIFSAVLLRLIVCDLFRLVENLQNQVFAVSSLQESLHSCEICVSSETRAPAGAQMLCVPAHPWILRRRSFAPSAPSCVRV